MTAPELTKVPEAAWEEARRCLPVIRRLAESSDRTRAEVKAAAAELGYGPTHVYSLIRSYTADPRLTSLLPSKRGRAFGYSKLDSEVEAIINDVIDSLYLTRQKPKIVDLVAEVQRRCIARGLEAPGRKGVTARLRARPAQEVVAKREGRKAARDRYAPAIGSLEAHWPLSLIQIDHTLVDVIVVDSETRAPIQRPWLTLAMSARAALPASISRWSRRRRRRLRFASPMPRSARKAGWQSAVSMRSGRCAACRSGCISTMPRSSGPRR